MPTSPLTLEYRVTSINEAGNDRIMVNFTQEVDAPVAGAAVPTYGTGTISLNLSAAEAANYFPGQKYAVAFTAAD